MAETAHTGGYGTPYSSSGQTDGGDVRDRAQEKAQEVKEQAAQQAQHVAGQARGRMRAEVDNRSTQLGQQISQQAGDLRSLSEQLRSQGKEGPAKVADQIAERADRAGRWMTDSDGERILHEIEDFGRRNPWAVMAGGLALGVLASRFLKASSQHRYERRGLSATGPAASGHELPEHATGGYRTDPGDRFTRGVPSSY
jgi:glucan phosphorylase